MSSMLKSIVVAPVWIAFILCAAFASNSNANAASGLQIAKALIDKAMGTESLAFAWLK